MDAHDGAESIEKQLESSINQYDLAKSQPITIPTPITEEPTWPSLEKTSVGTKPNLKLEKDIDYMKRMRTDLNSFLLSLAPPVDPRNM